MKQLLQNLRNDKVLRDTYKAFCIAKFITMLNLKGRR